MDINFNGAEIFVLFLPGKHFSSVKDAGWSNNHKMQTHCTAKSPNCKEGELKLISRRNVSCSCRDDDNNSPSCDDSL